MKRSMIQSSQSLIQPPVKKSHFANNNNNNNNNDQLLLTMSNFPLDLLTHPSAFQEVDSNQAQSSSTGKSSSSNSKIDYSQPIIIIRDDDDDDDDEESDFTDQFLLNQPIKSSPAFDMNEEMEIIFIDDEKLPNKEMIDNIRECDTVTLTNNNNNDDDGNNAANLLINESCPILDITPFTFPSTDATNTCLNNADADENAVESINNNNNNNNNGIEIIEQIIIAPPIQQQALDAESSENTDKQSLSLLNYQSKKIPELINDADDHQVKEKLRLEREKYVDTWNKMSDIEKCSKDFISKFGINIWQDPVESVLDINYYLNDSNNSKEFEDELVKNFTSKESDRNFEIIDNAFSKVMESIVNDVNEGTQQSELLNLNINENDLGIDLLLSEDKLQNTLENSCIISGSQKEISTRLTGSAELGKDSAGKNSPSFTDEEAIESILIAMNKMWFKH